MTVIVDLRTYSSVSATRLAVASSVERYPRMRCLVTVGVLMVVVVVAVIHGASGM